MAGPSCHCREVRDFKVGIGVWLGRAHQLVECAHYQPAFLVGYARCAVAHELFVLRHGNFRPAGVWRLLPPVPAPLNDGAGNVGKSEPTARWPWLAEPVWRR